MTQTPSHPRVLLADGDPVVRHIGAALLERLQADFSVASSGEEALALAASGWDLVLLDRRLPGVTGDRTAGLWRERNLPARRIIGLALPALSQGEDLDPVEDFDEILIKPLTLQKLGALLNAYQHVESVPEKPTGLENFKGLLDDYSGFETILAGVIETFKKDWPIEKAALQNALETGDAEKLRAMGHKIKGETLTLTMTKASSLAARLEHAAGTGNSDQWHLVCSELIQEVERQVCVLDNLLKLLAI